MRTLKYNEALGEGTLNAMEENSRVFLIGEGIDDPKGAFGTCLPAFKKYGSKRVFDSPLSEATVTGMGIGAAIMGNPNVMIHMRAEFLLFAMDQIINHAAKWRYMSGGKTSVPVVIRMIIGRGWGQAAQHSQSFHAMWAHVPGLKVILPATPADAKGMIHAAIADPDPVLSIEHRWLYGKEGDVPEGRYVAPLNKAAVLREGKDITCVAVSHQIYDALAAAEELSKKGIEMEVIDLRSAKPIDETTILDSVRKTGRLIVTDIGIETCGITAEVITIACEKAFSSLKAAPVRIALPDVPTPCSYTLEEIYYPKMSDIVGAAKSLVKGERFLPTARQKPTAPTAVPFTGPF